MSWTVNTATNTISTSYTLDAQKININDLNLDSNNLNVSGKLKESGNDLLPKGSIIMWNGNTAPNGWVICDGNSHKGFDNSNIVTPDLRGRFILGHNPSIVPNNGDLSKITSNDLPDLSSQARTKKNYIGLVGGEYQHKLTINEIPTHNHNIQNGGLHRHGERGWNDVVHRSGNPGLISGSYRQVSSRARLDGDPFDVKMDPGGNHTHACDNTGGSVSYNILPPYYVLAYIMKL
jgi:microcystin-dependent protein